MRIDVLLKLVYTCFVSDPPEQNFARMAEAAALLEEIGGRADVAGGDLLRRARINYATGRIHFYRGDVPEAIKYYRQVLPIAEASGDEELLALPSCLIGTALLTKGHASEAEPLLAQAIGPLERLGEPFEWFRAVGYHGASLIATGRYPEGIARLDAVLSHGKEIGQASLLSAAYLMRGSSFLLSGDWPLVIENLSAVIDLAGETGDKLHMSLAWSGIGWARSHLGSVESGRACRQRGADIARELGGQLMLADWYRAGDAEMALHAGDLDRAIELGEELAGRSATSDLLFSQGIAERVWGEVLAQYGRHDEADAHLRASIAALERGGLILQAAWSRMRWAVRLRARGDEPAAQGLFDEAEVQFTRASCAYALGEVNRLRALLSEP
jgi:tetratricopeptide (TPR) repeat protein